MRHYAYILPIIALLAACTSDELLAPDTEATSAPSHASRILLTGSTGVTRGLPQAEGECKADKARIWLWKYKLSTSHRVDWFSHDKLELYDTKDISVNNKIVDGNTVKAGEYTKANEEFEGGSHHTYYAAWCLGYKETESTWFTCSVQSNHIAGATLSIEPNEDMYRTPDLYFGSLKIDTPSGAKRDDDADDHDELNDTYGIVHFHYVWGGETHDLTLRNYTSVFRIVSQTNIILTNVNTSIKSIDLIASNVPTTIGLYGRHGSDTYRLSHSDDPKAYIYPVKAASNTQQTATEKTVAHVDLTNNVDDHATVTLTTNFLPSVTGRTLKLHVVYKGEGKMQMVNNPDGTISYTTIPSEDFHIQPAQNAVLTGGNAKYDKVVDNIPHTSDIPTLQAYINNNPRLYVDAINNIQGLYVYKPATHEFFSYSNVKLNVKGDMKDLVEDHDRAAFTIEVEPAYEMSHHYDAQ